MLGKGVERLVLEAATSLEAQERAPETRDGSRGRSWAGRQGASRVHNQGLGLGVAVGQAGPSRMADHFIRSQIPSRNERALNPIISGNASLPTSRNPLPTPHPPSRAH